MNHQICDACECVSHCAKSGCIPIQPLPASYQAAVDASGEECALVDTSAVRAPVQEIDAEALEVAADIHRLLASAPDHIWLDLGENLEALTDDATFRDLGGVTWSEDNATGVGIKYVRAAATSLEGQK